MKKYFSKILYVVMILIFITTLMITVQAVDSNIDNGSLKITKYETGKKDQEGNNMPLAGVKFYIYQVSDDYNLTTIPENASIYKEATTSNNGVANFENLPLGRYLVIEAEAPENVIEKTANFLVDIPMTNENGNGLIYNVEVKPKNNTVYGGVTLNKIDKEGNPLVGVTFKLEEKKNGAWKERKIIGADGAEKTLATSDEGIIVVDGLPQGEYRFVETSTLPKYILDNKTTYEFEVSMDQETKKTITTPDTFDILNEQLEITKEVTNADNEENSFNATDEIDFDITVDVPKTIADLEIYTITDILPEGLDYKKDSIKVVGMKNADTKVLAKTNYTISVQERDITIEFDNKSILSNYDSLKISYTTVFNGKENYISANENKVQLKYSSQVLEATSETVITKEASQSVYTGGFYIKKFEKDNEDKLLGGAEFKIALSEEDAKNENFIKINNEDVVITTDSQTGLASYGGLKYGTYYLVETKAPTYIIDGQEKSYKKLTRPIEILVNENTFKEENANKIANAKITGLPAAGGSGTIVFYEIGIILVAVSVILIKVKKRR